MSKTGESTHRGRQWWREAYEGSCPRCGADLADPDHHLARTCNTCGITVEAAMVEVWDEGRSTTTRS